MLDHTNKNLNLEAEATLDPTIEFPHPLSENSKNPKSIFLTGSTGLLGAYLLVDLLAKTTANVYCLVRSSDGESASSLLNRIQKNLEFYSLWEENYASRIIPIVGDLSLPLLGISLENFNQLAGEIDVIYHSGAMVTPNPSYSTLKGANVLGTQEVLRLASLRQTKPVHFVSSIAVFFSKAHSQVREITETEIPNLSDIQGGYKQSKAVAERLAIEARERGLPLCIYRPSRIGGDSRTGIGNTQDLCWTVLKGCIHLGKVPALETGINMVPVDYLSQAIVGLSQLEESLGKAFNLSNPQPLPWEKLFGAISAFGYAVEKVSDEELLKEVEKYLARNPEDELYSSLLLFLSGSGVSLRAKKPKFDNSNTTEELAKIGITCPVVDQKLLTTYISYFQKSGYFPTPGNS